MQQVQDIGISLEFDKIFMIAQGLYSRRNQMVFENKLVHLKEATNEALSLHKYFKDMSNNIKKPNSSKKS